jgi:hypothetical protein
MGLQQSVSFAQGIVPRWTDVSELLERCKFPVQVRMIDGELALPDDAVADNWRDLRVSTPLGMVTVRREGEGIIVATWSNAAADLKQAWNALAWAFAEVGDGRIDTPEGQRDRKSFHRSADLPSAMKP